MIVLISRVLILIKSTNVHAYSESPYRLTTPRDPELGVTTSDDAGVW